jgi:hypothetical protein
MIIEEAIPLNHLAHYHNLYSGGKQYLTALTRVYSVYFT